MALIPIKTIDGSPYNGQCNRYHVAATDATAIFIGDAVTRTGEADEYGVPTVTQSAAGDVISGVVVGIDFSGPAPVNVSDETTHRTASTEMYILVADAPDLICEIAEDGDTTPLTAASVGLNADLVVGSGNVNSGRSAMLIDSDTAVSTTAQLRILNKRQIPDNEFGAGCVWEVLINEHAIKQVAGV